MSKLWGSLQSGRRFYIYCRKFINVYDGSTGSGVFSNMDEMWTREQKQPDGFQITKKSSHILYGNSFFILYFVKITSSKLPERQPQRQPSHRPSGCCPTVFCVSNRFYLIQFAVFNKLKNTIYCGCSV